MQFPITIGLHRSRFLDLGFGFIALLASGVILTFPQSALFQLLIFTAIWVAAGIAWRQLSPKCSAIRLEHSGQISVVCHGTNDFLPAELLPDATVHPWLTVFRLKTESGDAFILFATVDSLKRQNFRRLRVFLRWQADFNALNDDA